MVATSKDIHVIELLEKQFYTFSQEIIEANYLQPLSQDSSGSALPEKLKVNLKDGDLERLQHGGMHVGRAQFWAHIFNEKCKEICPTYTKQVFEDLSAELGLNEKQILVLIRYALLFHDSARQNEAQDKWDAESGKKCYEFLLEQGISPELAEIFSNAAVFKDHPDKFAKFIKDKKIDEKSIASFQYIRKLIYLSDCADIMRCVGNFQLKKLLIPFIDVPEFKADIHTEKLIEMTKHIYIILKKQGDMLFPCIIILPNGKVLDFGDSQSCYNLKTKVAFEHAYNVCSALGASITEDSYFATYLVNETFLNTKKASVKPVFNPYIHGTNSFILPMLKRTNFTMLASIEMLERYGLAPMCGELDNTLFGGGIDSYNPQRYICFGRMLSRGKDEYGLERISGSYTGYSLVTAEYTTTMAQQYANEAVVCGFENINKLLIHFTRAKQLGVEPLSSEKYKNLLEQFNGSIKFYYFLMLLGKYIYPNFELYNKLRQEFRDAVIDCPEIREQFERRKLAAEEFGIDFDLTFEAFLEMKRDSTDIIIDSIYTHLTFQKLFEKIMQLDMKNIYENPTEENLKKVLTILEFPKTSLIGTGPLLRKKKEVTLTETQFFTLTKSYPDKCYDIYTEEMLYQVFKNKDGRLEELLVNFFMGKTTLDTFANLEKIIFKRINILPKKIALLEKIAAIDAHEIKFSQEEMEFMKKPFPIILVCTSEEKISLCNFSTQEYRSHQSLKFGEDITIVATDNREHQLLIMKFLRANQVQNVQVILINQLIKSKNDKEVPISSYTHSDGFPRLSFFAASAVPSDVASDDETTKEMIDAAKQYLDLELF